MAPTNRPPVASEEWDYIPDEVAGPQTDDPRCSRPTDEDISYFTGMFGGSPTQWAEVAAIVTAFSRPNGDRYIVAARADGVVKLAATNEVRASMVQFPDETGYLQWTDEEKAAVAVAAEIAIACLGDIGLD